MKFLTKLFKKKETYKSSPEKDNVAPRHDQEPEKRAPAPQETLREEPNMDRNQAGQMLAEAIIEADQIAKMDGVMGTPAKAPVVGMIIQNLHESLLALDKGVDVVGDPISPKQIGEGLKSMLDHLSAHSQWEILQEGLSVVDVNRTVKLTGRIRAASTALLNVV